MGVHLLFKTPVKLYKRTGDFSPVEYAELLSRARSRLPESVFEKERFEIPKTLGHIEGNKTVISNFVSIADTLRRPVDHILKYILKELATPGVLRGSLLVLGTKIPSTRINDKLRQYADEFVLCAECGKPDTNIIHEGDFAFLRCQACGAKKQVKAKL
ncbi:translation initiation factor IF-2 subunit beta [Candidatus Woesearchaeota archaeon]|nr:translation initiation factor IF-2 subunit beta [Candidatus Woesearchaeota archaeon]